MYAFIEAEFCQWVNFCAWCATEEAAAHNYQIYLWEATVPVFSRLLTLCHSLKCTLPSPLHGESALLPHSGETKWGSAGGYKSSSCCGSLLGTNMTGCYHGHITDNSQRTLRLKVSHGNWFTSTTKWSERNCSAFHVLNCFQYMQLLKPSLHSISPANWM